MDTQLIPTYVIAVFIVLIVMAIWRYLSDIKHAMVLIEPCANTLDELFDRVRWKQHANPRGLEYSLTRSGIWDILRTLDRIGSVNHIDRYAITSALNALCRHDVQWVASPTGFGVLFDEGSLVGTIHWNLNDRSIETVEGSV